MPHVASLALVALAVVLAYANAPGTTFVFDARALVAENPILREGTMAKSRWSWAASGWRPSSAAVDRRTPTRFTEKMRKRSHADDTIPQVGDHVLYDNRSLADPEAKQRLVDLHRAFPAGDAPIVLADLFTQARMGDAAAQARAEVAACATEGS